LSIIKAKENFSMVFGNQKLQDEVFCRTQERDFFQSKYLEQISKLQYMKNKLENYKKEINRLRRELLSRSPTANSALLMHSSRGSSRRAGKTNSTNFLPVETITEKNPDSRLDPLLGDIEIHTNESSTGNTRNCGEIGDQPAEQKDYDEFKEGSTDDDESAEMEKSIRDKASQLLVWADYRSSKRTNSNLFSNDPPFRDTKEEKNDDEDTLQSSASTLSQSFRCRVID